MRNVRALYSHSGKLCNESQNIGIRKIGETDAGI